MSWRPHQAAVDGLINRYTKGPDALQNQRNLELLTKVGDSLETMEPKLRTQLQSSGQIQIDTAQSTNLIHN